MKRWMLFKEGEYAEEMEAAGRRGTARMTLEVRCVRCGPWRGSTMSSTRRQKTGVIRNRASLPGQHMQNSLIGNHCFFVALIVKQVYKKIPSSWYC